jgi:hypothetical protein
MKEGGTSRRDMIPKMLGDLGGSVDAFYFGFGGTDVYGPPDPGRDRRRDPHLRRLPSTGPVAAAPELQQPEITMA